MNQLTRRRTLATAWVFVTAWSGSARSQQGIIGQGLNEAGRAVRRGLQTAGQAVSGGLQRPRSTVQTMEVLSRVSCRLQWDKGLTGATIEIEVQDGGVVNLIGRVPSEDARLKALALASDTVGVTQVVDRLTMPTDPRPSVRQKQTEQMIRPPALPNPDLQGIDIPI